MRAILVLPGVFHSVNVDERWNIDCLRRLLARSDRQNSLNTGSKILFLSYILGLRCKMTESQLAYWSDFLRPPAEYCYYCNPVHLRADLSDAIVFDGSHFSLTPPEAQSFVDAINGYLQSSPYRVEIADPYRWYLLSVNQISHGIPTLREMSSRPVGSMLTNSSHAPAWRRLMNELQIVLHQQPANIERDQRGELPVNGVWIHEGSLVEAQDYAVSRIVTKSLYATTISHSLGLECEEELHELESVYNHGDILIYDESVAAETDSEKRKLQLESMEARWFRPMYTWLRQKKIDEIVIDPADGRRFVIYRKSLRRFWRHAPSFDVYAKQKP